MITGEVKLDGQSARLLASLRGMTLGIRLEEGIKKELHAGAMLYKRQLIESMVHTPTADPRQPAARSGRWKAAWQSRKYKADGVKSRGRKTRWHWASVPHYPPAPDKGFRGGLLGSIRIDDDFTAGVFTVFSNLLRGSAPYPVLLETGTRFMAARPAWGPAWELIEPWVKSNVAKRMERIIGGGPK